MPRVVPSQVVGLIDLNFPTAKSTPDFPLYSNSAGILNAIVRLTHEIPTELLALNANQYSDLVCGLESVSSAVTRWHQRGGDDPPARVNGKSPVAVVRESLSRCPDEIPEPGTVGLVFITDSALQDSIRLDISAANRDASNGEWKGATVLAGSAAEALLLWAIKDAEQKSARSIAGAIAALRSAGTFGQQQPGGNNPERWFFAELIEVAHQLGKIGDTTTAQVSLCKDFRNLIHPGRAIRLGQICDRGTALSALAAVEFIARDLTP
jgi:hypothetical protein